MLAVHCGLRQGELLGLRWEDVDLEAGTLHVRRTLTLAKDGPKFMAPKTAKSCRQIRFTTGAVEALKRHHDRQFERVHAAHRAVARLRACIRDDDQDSYQSPQPYGPFIQAVAQASRTARHTLPRSAAHLRDATVAKERASEIGSRAIGARHDCGNSGHVFSSCAGNRAPGSERDGERTRVAGCSKSAPAGTRGYYGSAQFAGVFLARSAGLEPATF